MKNVSTSQSVERFGLLASAIARRPLRVAAAQPGELAWTDGSVIYIDMHTREHEQLQALAVQASLLAAGSLERWIVLRLARRSTLAKRYLAVEGHRALASLDGLLPPMTRSLIRRDVAIRSDSPRASLSLASDPGAALNPPVSFGTISAKRLLDTMRSAERARWSAQAAHVQTSRTLTEFAADADAQADADAKDAFSPLGGGGPIARWFAKLLAPAQRARGVGAPGEDAPTHWTRTGRRGASRAVLSTVARNIEDSRSEEREQGAKYPEWDANEGRYRPDFCTVYELAAPCKRGVARFALPDRTGLRRSLARLGVGIDRYHRQAQGDDIDIDAAIEAFIECKAGSSPNETAFIDSVRRRRELSVLVLLDVSGSAAEPSSDSKTVHEHQRASAALLTLALHELGDRVALYAYCSRGRSTVNLTPIKRFHEAPGALVLERLGSLEAGAYSRLGAAIRHGTAVLRDDAGTPRQLLVVISDGLAYDHGYELAYGAADARRALSEARTQGVGCLCLSVGASTDAEALRCVFGSSAYAALPTPADLKNVIGPLFRAGIRSADTRRRLS